MLSSKPGDNPVLTPCGHGVWSAPGARIIDHAGRKKLPVGHDGFEPAAEAFTLVDKTMLIADVLESGSVATLFCRPRRFGKTLNLTMMKAFFEAAPDGRSRAGLFEGTEVWDAGGGAYRVHQGAYPVVHFSFNGLKQREWALEYQTMRLLVAAEYQRHGYLAQSPRLSDADHDYFASMSNGFASEADLIQSLVMLCRMLCKHHGRRVVLLVDEYDAPVMAGYSAPGGGYYPEVVSFLKGWLTSALKDGGEALEFAVLTGVQRISKESIFSDLNNLTVSTALNTESDERYGFTEAEVAALAAYLGHDACMDEARAWYDGYRFGTVDVYNPWSAVNYLKSACTADVYWGNTSSNSVVGDLVRQADAHTLGQVYRLLEPGGVVNAPLDLSVVFPDIGVRPGAVWSMLYLAGYLTTDDVAQPNNTLVPRRLRIPNREIAELYRKEVVERFAAESGGQQRLGDLHAALVSGDAPALTSELSRIVRESASCHDLTSENGCHMLLLGLCFGISGYADPVSNRESGHGRPDLQIVPCAWPFPVAAPRPLITIEVKFAKGADEGALAALADAALAQIAERGYDDVTLPPEASGRMRIGCAFNGKRMVAACELVQ